MPLITVGSFCIICWSRTNTKPNTSQSNLNRVKLHWPLPEQQSTSHMPKRSSNNRSRSMDVFLATKTACVMCGLSHIENKITVWLKLLKSQEINCRLGTKTTHLMQCGYFLSRCCSNNISVLCWWSFALQLLLSKFRTLLMFNAVLGLHWIIMVI